MRRALDRCGPRQAAPPGRKSKTKNLSQFSFLARVFQLFSPAPRSVQKNFAPGSRRNDDLGLGPPIASSFRRSSLHPLREAQLCLQRSLHVTRTKHLLLQTFFHGSPENFWAV